MILKNKFKTGF